MLLKLCGSSVSWAGKGNCRRTGERMHKVRLRSCVFDALHFLEAAPVVLLPPLPLPFPALARHDRSQQLGLAEGAETTVRPVHERQAGTQRARLRRAAQRVSPAWPKPEPKPAAARTSQAARTRQRRHRRRRALDGRSSRKEDRLRASLCQRSSHAPAIAASAVLQYEPSDKVAAGVREIEGSHLAAAQRLIHDATSQDRHRQVELGQASAAQLEGLAAPGRARLRRPRRELKLLIGAERRRLPRARAGA